MFYRMNLTPRRTYELLDEMRRLLRDLPGTGGAQQASSDFPAVNIFENDAAYVLTAALPGLAADQVKVSTQENVLTLSGTREVVVPEGYSVHRRERGTNRFARSFSFPSRVDFGKTDAKLKDGILTLTVPKHPEAQPRQISIQS